MTAPLIESERAAFVAWLIESKSRSPSTAQIYARLLEREAAGEEIAATSIGQLEAAKSALRAFRGGPDLVPSIWTTAEEREAFVKWLFEGGRLAPSSMMRMLSALESGRESASSIAGRQLLDEFRFKKGDSATALPRSVLHAAFFLAMDITGIAHAYDRKTETTLSFLQKMGDWPESIAELKWSNIGPFDRAANASWCIVVANRDAKPYQDAYGVFWGIWALRLALWANLSSLGPERIRITPLVGRKPGSLTGFTKKEMAAMFRNEMEKNGSFRRNEEFTEWQMHRGDEMRYVESVSQDIYKLRMDQTQAIYETSRNMEYYRVSIDRAQAELQKNRSYSIWDGERVST